MTVFDGVNIDTAFGWRVTEKSWGSIWFKGCIYNYSNPAEFAKRIYRYIKDNNSSELCKILSDADGHFSIVIRADDLLFAAVDRIRSIPLFFVERQSTFLLTDQPNRIVGKLNKRELTLNSQAKLMMSMSGFCSGDSTLISGLKQLQSGEYLKFENRKKLNILKYYKYHPINPMKDKSKLFLKKELELISIRIIQKIIDSAENRMILVPLSGGLDSRLVASGLAELGYKNVKCFSYGKKKNFESLTSEIIAKKLGYKWKFIELTHSRVRDDYNSSLHEEYHKYCNTFASVPVEHEYSAIRSLKESGWAPDDSIIVNGMSGDYLTGSHIPEIFHRSEFYVDEEGRKDRILTSIIDKHYSLWENLKTQENIKIVSDILWREIADEIDGLPEKIDNDFGLYEFSEFKNRQTKYVITVQRVYEFFGYEWRLPLWDKEYLDYWEKIHKCHKINRSLFVNVMHDLDWGGVWSMKYPKNSLTPRWIAIIRFLTKIFFVLSRKEVWKKYDKKIFYYWIEILCKMGVVNYRDVLLDRRGYRNAVSWLTDNYLEKMKLIYKTKHYN